MNNSLLNEGVVIYLYFPPLCRMRNITSAVTSKMVICTLGFIITVRRLRYSVFLFLRRVYEYLLGILSPQELK